MKTFIAITLLFAGLTELLAGNTENSKSADFLELISPIHEAAAKGDLFAVKFLIVLGADVNGKEGLSYSPLHLAAYHGYSDVVEYLIENGADVNATDDDLNFPIHFAAHAVHVNGTRDVVERGVDVNARNNERSTALHLAACWGHPEIVKYLIEKNAVVHTKNGNEQTPLDIAISKLQMACKDPLEGSAFLAENDVKTNGANDLEPSSCDVAVLSDRTNVGSILEAANDILVKNGGGAKEDILRFIIEKGMPTAHNKQIVANIKRRMEVYKLLSEAEINEISGK